MIYLIITCEGGVEMKAKLASMVIALTLIFCTHAYSEEAFIKTYTVRNGEKEAMFSYPQNCTIEDEDSLGVIVRLDANSYIAVSIPRRGMSGTKKLLENIGDESKIIKLTDDVYLFSTHGDENHRMYNTDIVEVGIDLKNDIGLIINITCPYGETEIYKAAAIIIESLIDDDIFTGWLTEKWIPSIIIE